MPKEGQKTFDYLLQSTVAAGAGVLEQVIPKGKFNVKCWDVLGGNDFDGLTVQVQMKTEDDNWIPVYTFSSDGVQFGEVGSEHEVFRGFILTPSTREISLSIVYG